MQRYRLLALALALLPACDRLTARPESAEETRRAQERSAKEALERSHVEWRRLCQELGARRAANQREELKGTQWGQVPPFYCYHEARNTCIYSGGDVNTGNGMIIMASVDLMTNEDIASFFGHQGQRSTPEDTANRHAYDKKREDLQSGCVLR